MGNAKRTVLLTSTQQLNRNKLAGSGYGNGVGDGWGCPDSVWGDGENDYNIKGEVYLMCPLGVVNPGWPVLVRQYA